MSTTGTGQFWDGQFADVAFRYGTAPNAFIAAQAGRIPVGAEVLAVGAGEGRNAVWLAEQGFRVTALDLSEVGLAKTRRLADERGVSVETVQADVRVWRPERAWDAAVCTFLHLGPAKRSVLYRALRTSLRPGGLLLAEWYRPEQVTEGYTSGGPPDVAMMVPLAELRTAFAADELLLAEAVEVVLNEGVHHG
ncbi:MAG: class I SAM-dependent methyltransferase, partial [Rhodothermaceae bacterium]|nr:class I SAM-dependent methyltransferase [Rhodothermaceae bacterium]